MKYFEHRWADKPRTSIKHRQIVMIKDRNKDGREVIWLSFVGPTGPWLLIQRLFNESLTKKPYGDHASLGTRQPTYINQCYRLPLNHHHHYVQYFRFTLYRPTMLSCIVLPGRLFAIQVPTLSEVVLSGAFQSRGPPMWLLWRDEAQSCCSELYVHLNYVVVTERTHYYNRSFVQYADRRSPRSGS